MLLLWLAVIGGATLLLYRVAVLVAISGRFPNQLEQAGPAAMRRGAVMMWVVLLATMYLSFRRMLSGWLPLGVREAVFVLAVLVVSAAAGHLFVRLVAKTRLQSWAACCVIGAAAVMWWFWPNWLTVDLLAVLVAATILSGVAWMGLSFRLSLGVTLMAATVDAFGVLLTDITVKNVSQAIMQARPSPTHILLPRHWQLDLNWASSVGVADIVVPGILVIVAGFIARRYRAGSVLHGSLIGYAVGLTAAVVVMRVTNIPQPGLTYICPSVAIGLVFAAWRAGLLGEMWRYGDTKRHKPAVDADRV